MIADDRLATIADLCRRAEQRMDSAYPWQLLRACDELLAEMHRLRPVQPRLLDAAS